MAMDVAAAQADIRRAYVGGGPGIVISGLVWSAASLALARNGIAFAFAVLFVGGMLIFPLSKLIVRFGFRRADESAGNPIGRVALESTFAMIGVLLLAWLLLGSRPEAAFPVAAVAIGTHYFPFRTLYGDARYWLLALLVTLVGLAGLLRPGVPVAPAVALLELLFGVWFTLGARRPA